MRSCFPLDKLLTVCVCGGRYFERYARGNKPYYSAGLGKGAGEATSAPLVQITPLVVYFIMLEEQRDRAILLGREGHAHDNLKFSVRHASPFTIEGSIHDLVRLECAIAMFHIGRLSSGVVAGIPIH